ncbi:hypothetical protein D3C76_1491900 [compost metagenome]
MQWVSFKESQNLATTTTGGGWNSEQNFLDTGSVDHLLDMLRLIDLQPRDYPIRNTVIIINKRDRTHHASHAESSHQLITSRTRTINCNLWQTIITVSERDMLSS